VLANVLAQFQRTIPRAWMRSRNTRSACAVTRPHGGAPRARSVHQPRPEPRAHPVSNPDRSRTRYRARFRAQSPNRARMREKPRKPIICAWPALRLTNGSCSAWLRETALSQPHAREIRVFGRDNALAVHEIHLFGRGNALSCTRSGRTPPSVRAKSNAPHGAFATREHLRERSRNNPHAAFATASRIFDRKNERAPSCEGWSECYSFVE
jgi:hypothetical protein